jgi:hypothetical protein
VQLGPEVISEHITHVQMQPSHSTSASHARIAQLVAKSAELAADATASALQVVARAGELAQLMPFIVELDGEHPEIVPLHGRHASLHEQRHMCHTKDGRATQPSPCGGSPLRGYCTCAHLWAWQHVMSTTQQLST